MKNGFTSTSAPLVISIFLAVSGFAPLSNALNKPGIQALRAVDIIGLMAAGVCFGAALMLFAILIVTPRLKARQDQA